ncbi:MAG: ThuA domain-containing protein [Planctomycetaceae bacterium]|nr:ThuA domain-containing protein [Planctomycetaceae bacterium]
MSKQIRTICCLAVAAAAVVMIFAAVSEAQEAKKAKALHFTRSRGFIHDPARWIPAEEATISGKALKKYFADKNIEVVETQDGGVFDGDISQYDVFIFYTSGKLSDEKEIDKDGNDRREPQEHAITKAGFDKLLAAIRAGKGFVGIHSATDSLFDTGDANDSYTKLVGARFVSHGAQQSATVSATKPIQVPWIKKLPDGKDTAWEEWYAMKWYNPDIHVILVQETAGMKGAQYERPNFPSSWIRSEGKGRVAYLAYGHRNDFWIDPPGGPSKENPIGSAESIKKVGDIVEWAVGRYELDTTPNLKEVTPGAETLTNK